jgi:catechol 2,3-dioxygenase-like lactoylglutathione lyase family enzyme
VSFVSSVVESFDMRARVRRILETVLYCDDLARSAAFYQTLLTTTPMLTGDRLVALEAGEGTVLLLFQRGNSGALETAGGLVPGHDGGGPVHLAFAIDADTVAAWEARLAEMGIAIESRVRWDRGGQSIYFRDPEGRSVELATPGLWPSY